MEKSKGCISCSGHKFCGRCGAQLPEVVAAKLEGVAAVLATIAECREAVIENVEYHSQTISDLDLLVEKIYDEPYAAELKDKL